MFQFNENGLWFASLNLNILIKKKRQKNAPFVDDASKTRDIKLSNVETCMLFASPLQKFLATCLGSPLLTYVVL